MSQKQIRNHNTQFTRREVLFLSVITASASVIFPSVAHSSVSEKSQSPSSEELLDMVGDAMFPKDRYIPYTPSELNLAREILKGLDRLHPSMKKEFLLALRAVEIFPLLDLKWKRFSSMSPEERTEYINSWARSRLFIKRKIFVALKSAIAFAYFSNKKVWNHIGYEGPWVSKNERR